MTTPEADVYGQIHPVESPSMIETGLSNLEKELSLISDEAKKALDRAIEKCPEVVNDRHKLMFLRCEVFNADLAAARLVKYWAKRLELFGEQRAFRSLTLANIYEEEDDAGLKMGFVRLIPVTDNTGRSIVFVDPSKQDRTKYTREMLVRSLWYVFHAALENEGAQKNGIVCMAFPKNAEVSQIDRTQMKMNMESIKGLIPARLSAFHIVHPPTFFRVIFPFMKLLMGARLRKRIKVYSGLDEHIVESLEKFGIYPDSIPVDIGGKLVLDHDAWIRERRVKGL